SKIGNAATVSLRVPTHLEVDHGGRLTSPRHRPRSRHAAVVLEDAGRTLIAAGTISAFRDPTQQNCAITTNCGIAESCRPLPKSRRSVRLMCTSWQEFAQV
ncbi:hypothetical protein, partial [Lentzea roselyniae]|uniref:hypothetical protein n=1 Tax=Lentzea roselyniae TaxID=531940 RepID=UPI0031F94D91